MNRSVLLTLGLLFLIFVSCQKENSFEQGQPSMGSLQGDGGDCLPKKVNGTYTANQNLGDSNYIDVTIDVGQTGYYKIYTDTVNGYYFLGSGNFTSIGTSTVRLKGNGKPALAGNNDFTVIYDTTACFVSVTVLPSTGGSSGTSAFTLQTNAGVCMTSNLVGTYTQGTALTSANKVNIQVNVTTVGTWSLSTGAVSGFSFSGSGTFTTTGVQTITLTATGTPVTSGILSIPISAGASSCSFEVTVAPGTPPPATSTDYFPLTANSYWTYNDPTSPGDTLKRVNATTATHNGNVYRVFQETDVSGPAAEYHYRKIGNDYFEYVPVDNYSILTFDTNIEGDILFLKEGISTGTAWLSSEYSGTVNGTPKKLRYSFSCTDANATVTINTNTFSNVYKITFKSQVSTSGGAFADEGIVTEAYYAKGVGLVYMKTTYGIISFELKLRYYRVF